MYFEGRDLTDHAEPVSASELCEGQVYFAVNYVDGEMLIPIMETIVFIGRNLEPDDAGQVYFQDVESHREVFHMIGRLPTVRQSSRAARQMRSVTSSTTDMHWKN